MKKINRIKYIFAATLALFVFAVTCDITSGAGVKAFAASTAYSSVIEDLTKDPEFNFSVYEENVNDTSIRIIQIAEGEDNELFIYTYQPSAGAYDMTLKTIRFSTSAAGDVWKDYGLNHLSTWGVFAKYKVGGFEVSPAKMRYYNITAVHRDYIKYVDEDNLSNEKAVAVKIAQLWTAVTVNNSVSYSMEMTDVIEIRDCKYGSIRVPSGFNFNTSYACDMHIIAFSTDIKIEKLLEADVTFDYRSVDKGIYDTDYGEWQPKTVTVTYKEKGSSSDHIFGQSKRTWDRIQTSSEFLNTCSKFEIDVPSEISDGIKSTEWVLAFWETEFQNSTGGVFGWLTWIGAVCGFSYNHYTQVSNASVLRLEFIRDGQVYNLGVVSNKSGDFSVIGGGDETFTDAVKNAVNDFFKGIWENILGFLKNTFGGLKWWHWVLIVLAVLIAVPIILSIFIKGARKGVLIVLTAVGKGLLWLLKLIWRIICAPFRFIAWIFGKGKKANE